MTGASYYARFQDVNGIRTPVVLYRREVEGDENFEQIPAADVGPLVAQSFHAAKGAM